MNDRPSTVLIVGATGSIGPAVDGVDAIVFTHGPPANGATSW
jgi:hypothetical protein